jgi:hypothetical protein
MSYIPYNNVVFVLSRAVVHMQPDISFAIASAQEMVMDEAGNCVGSLACMLGFLNQVEDL